MTAQPDDTAVRTGHDPTVGAGARVRRYAVGFVLGCLAGSSMTAWAVGDNGSSPAATEAEEAPRPAVAMSADAAEHRAEERRADCRTLGTADAIDRCLEAVTGFDG